MKFLVMHKHDKNTEAGVLPPPTLIAAMGELVGGMAQAGKLLDGAGLGATKNRSRVTQHAGDHRVEHGPYAAGEHELCGSVLRVKVGSRDDAVGWAKQLCQVVGDGSQVEVGRVNEPWDLGIMPKPADAPERYLLVVRATAESEAGRAPDFSSVKARMTSAGVLETAADLGPTSRAKRIVFKGSSRRVIDGPFLETKELIGGYAVLDLESIDACIAFCGKYAEILLTVAERLEIDIRPLA